MTSDSSCVDKIKISRNTVLERHPLNVKPSGNSLVFRDNALVLKKAQLLGDFAAFPDELLLDLISYIDNVDDLLSLSHASRVFYAFLYDEEVWKKLYLRNKLVFSQWKGSWRRSILKLPESKEAQIQLPDNLLCSDLLFRPYQCCKINYLELFSELIKEETKSYHTQETVNKQFGIERIREADMDQTRFSEYIDKPFILTNDNPNRWPKWNLNTLLKRFSNVNFRQESQEWTLDLYSQYFESNVDESPLYLFDCQSTAMKEIVNEYEIPKIFQQDLFKLFQSQQDGAKSCRPDYRWLIVGPGRSGSTFHKDPNATSAWNANISGMKLWIMLPSHIQPPGVGVDNEESEVTSPVGVAEWCIGGFFNDCLKLAKLGDCLIGITFPGECMYVPSGWWHSVINLEDSVAITQNFVPFANLGKTLNFLKNKQSQISGFHLLDFKQFLSSFIKDNEIDDNENKKAITQFLSLNLNDNEDIGELKCEINPPIFQTFVELIKNSEYSDILANGLRQLEEIEASEASKREKALKKSKLWDSLVSNETESSSGLFSFNFDDENDD